MNMNGTIAPKHTRPFNADHAYNGAPFCCLNGTTAEILKWDGRSKEGYCLIGVYGPQDTPTTWRNDGYFGNSSREEFNLAMIPICYVDDKPVFTGDVLKDPEIVGHAGEFAVGPTMSKGFLTGCCWPALAAAYPESTINMASLACLLGFESFQVTGTTGSNQLSKFEVLQRGSCNMDDTIRAVANAVLRHAIDAGQVIAKQAHEEALIRLGEHLRNIAISQ